MKIVISDPPEALNRDIDAEIALFRDRLGPDTQVAIHPHTDDDALIEALRGATGLMTAYTPVSARVIAACPDLRAISINATGYDGVNTEAAAHNGTSVAVIAEYCTQEVADHATALLLAIARNLKHYDQDIQTRQTWDYGTTSGMFRLEGSVLGIMGFGKIGRAVARRAQGFGMQVIAVSPHLTDEDAAACHVQKVTAEELYARSHAIVLTMRLTPDNERIIDDRAFAAMTQHPVLVNIARGALIDEDALIRALDTGQIRGAGLDVLTEETAEHAQHSGLLGRDNVILTPHAAFYSETSMSENQRIGVDNLVHLLHGRMDQVRRVVVAGKRA